MLSDEINPLDTSILKETTLIDGRNLYKFQLAANINEIVTRAKEINVVKFDKIASAEFEFNNTELYLNEDEMHETNEFVHRIRLKDA